MIDLSIIIVNYNDRRFLEGCLNSVYNSTHKASFEIIFVDNHSTDDSVEYVKTHYPKVRLVENTANLGFCRANNRGLKVYRGRYALLLNMDTVVKDGAFDQMLEFMDSHPEAGACGPKLLNADGTPQHQGGLFNRKFWLATQPVKVDYVIGAALMVRREVIDRVGGLDENFFFSNDDLDWCRRIRQAGWQVYFLPQAEVVHFGGFTINRFKQKLFVEGFRGGLYFSRKHYGNLIYQIYRVLLILTMVPAILVSSLLYPLLTNKGKRGAFIQILMIAIRGELLPKYGAGKTVLLVSNGHAEDLAGAAIGARLRELVPDVELRALPLVGLGRAYDKKEIGNLGLRKILPSGGFAKEGLVHFIKDISAGLFGQLAKQISLLRSEAKVADLIVAVGDAYVVALCGLFGKKPLIFIDGPKSVKIEGYYAVERWLLKKYCKKVVVQDKETAGYLKKFGIPAEYLGSWVMDYVEVTGEDFGLEKDKTVIGLLPGTREEAYDNLLLILDVVDEIRGENLVGLVASTLETEKVKVKAAARGWSFSPLSEHSLTGKLTSRKGTTVLIAEGKFGDVCLRSKLIIGLAGIADEQAVAFGKPVVCFPGSGAQTTLRRWEEIEKITGDSLLILAGSAPEKAEKILALLHDQKKLEAMGQSGKASKPQWGGVNKIAQLVADNLK
ncbi:MAG: lipid-A-disaccharide synthase-related protein [Candidatus Margulisbacteria bacterium]|nr:lipid-A-disaccharide synthase-related protein [Candidatus Margulisiibacteriota bacterium]